MLDTVYRVVGVCRGIVVLLLVFWVRELWLCVLLAGWREVGVMKTEAGRSVQFGDVECVMCCRTGCDTSADE